MNILAGKRMKFVTPVGFLSTHRLFSADTDKVGFIGLGIMGSGMVRNLLNNKVPVVVWNRSAEKCIELKEEFGQLVSIAKTPCEVVSNCSTTISMLSTPEAMRSVYSGDNGVFAGVNKDASIVECGTFEPEDMVFASNEVNARGGKFLEAPVSGSKIPAAMGQLIFIAAGDESVVSGSRKYLNMMGKSVHYLGPKIGDGTKMKLVINSLMGNMLACLSESMHLADKSALNSRTLLDIIDESAIATPMFALKGVNMLKDRNENSIEDKYAPHFPLKHAHKDIRFAIGLSDNDDCTKMSQAAVKIFDKAEHTHKMGELDFSVVHESIYKELQ